MVEIPEVKTAKIPLLQRKALTEGVLGVSGVGGVIAATANAYTNATALPWVYPVLIASGVAGSVAVALKVSNAHKEDTKRTKTKSVEWLVATLHTLHVELCDDLGLDYPAAAGALRLTVHRVDWACTDERQQLEQSVEYVGVPMDPKKPCRGRRFPLRAGVIGTCAKDGKPVYAYRTSDDLEAFRKEMIDNHHFTAAEAKKLAEDRWSYAAYPIIIGNGPEAGAVVYADTVVKRAFKKAKPKDTLKRWCLGFAEYLRTNGDGGQDV